MPMLCCDDPGTDFRAPCQTPEHCPWDPDDLPVIAYPQGDLPGVRRALGAMFLRQLAQTPDPAITRRAMDRARKEHTVCAAL